MTQVQDVIETMKRIAPLHLAESWDNVGLLLGDATAPVHQVMTCLTITPVVVEEAVREKAEMIITHHPLLFKPLQRITAETNEGRILLKMAANNIAIYSAHTAYDNAADGINDQLAQGLGLVEVRPLCPAAAPASFKIVIFVPESDLAKVSEATFQAGAGVIGNYEQCSYRSAGIGTFFGTDQANPTIGQAGRREEVAEYRLEVLCSQANLAAALGAIQRAHSYETPAIDVHPLHPQSPVSTASEGPGRVGQLPVPLPSQILAEQIAYLLKTSVTLTGSHQGKMIKKIAIVCGAGGSLLPQAIEAGADAFLTGEIRFHDELAAQAAGVTVIAAGHYASERPGMEELARRLAKSLPSCKIWASCAEQNPAQWIPLPTKARSD